MENIVQTHVKEIGSLCVGWINLAQDIISLPSFVNVLIYLSFSKKMRNFLFI
jgi:hypothetical protein